MQVKYDIDDVVKFKYKVADKMYTLTGRVAVVDAFGTIEQTNSPSYDIFVHYDAELSNTITFPCLFKHIVQSDIIEIEEYSVLKFYVPVWDINSKNIKMFNIFNNVRVNDETIKLLKRYKHGNVRFDDFVKILEQLIKWQEWARCEYESSVGDPFCDDLNRLKKVDCYWYCKPNMEIIAHGIIKQWNNYLKNKK